ncbi:ATP-binding protein [Tenacibaculum geojense]|uniref:ATP-binding protein n=1 Tax=Tenacibaculum geojense TaxID=915352 RepID=A0ABW3JU41_9FLAO
MKKYILKVPSNQKARDWFQFVKESLNYVNDVDLLIVDFNNVRFMETDDFVILACLIESFYITNCEVKFIGGTERFNNHLFNVKFKEYWKEGFDRTKFTLSHNRTTLCLWKISEDMIYTYSMYAKQYFERYTNNKDLIPLSSNMDEVFNNVFDHSRSPVTGYIITQYYPKNNKISFSVCDFGIGIPTSINNDKASKEEKPLEDWKAILKSLERGFSINSTPRNRGFGLSNILELTETSNGKLLILSNNGFVEKSAGKMYVSGEVDFDFSGTLIKVEVDLNTFVEKDDLDEIFDF